MLTYKIVLNSGHQQEVQWPDHSLLEAFKRTDQVSPTKKHIMVATSPEGSSFAIDLCQVATLHLLHHDSDDVDRNVTNV